MPDSRMFPATTYAYNASCGVMPLAPNARRPDVTTSSDASTWRPHTGTGWAGSVGQVRLGLERHPSEWLSDDTAKGSLLVLRAVDDHDLLVEAERRGYATLDLWPLDGCHAALYTARRSRTGVGPRPVHGVPETPALLAGRALAGAWCHRDRLVVVGPDWALDWIAALPGAVEFVPSEPSSARRLSGTCRAHGRRWQAPGWPGPFEVAMRLAGPTTREHTRADDAIASMLVGPNGVNKAARKRVCAFAERDGAGELWRFDGGDLGPLTVKRTGEQWHGESVVRWPSAEDPWLVSLVGDGEPVVEDADADATLDLDTNDAETK